MLNRFFLHFALLTALVFSGQTAIAAGSENVSSTATARAPENPNYVAGKRAIEGGNWQAAIDAFNSVVAKDPGNANAHNFLGYAYRRSGQLEQAFRHYEEALRLDPKHRGAHEYIGETYLLANNLAKAEEHLRALDRLCTFGCEEYSDLKKAVANFKQKEKAASK